MSTILEVASSVETQIENRINLDLELFRGVLPERNAIAWHAYLAGLSEWGVIDLQTYSRLVKLLPQINEPDPVDAVILGRE